MKHHITLKQVAHSPDSAQNWNYETDSGVTCSRQSREGVGQSDREDLVQLHPAAAGQEVAKSDKIHGFLEEAKARQIFTAFASSAGSSPSPSARIASVKSFSFLKCRISRIASSRCFLNFSAAESLGRRPLRRSSFMSEAISSSLRSSSMVIRRYSNSIVLDPLVPSSQSVCLTLAAGRRYTGASRWEGFASRRASCHSTRRSFGLPSGIYELNSTSTGSLLPLCAATRTYEHR
jgi:hypothetical protein